MYIALGGEIDATSETVRHVEHAGEARGGGAQRPHGMVPPVYQASPYKRNNHNHIHHRIIVSAGRTNNVSHLEAEHVVGCLAGVLDGVALLALQAIYELELKQMRGHLRPFSTAKARCTRPLRTAHEL